MSKSKSIYKITITNWAEHNTKHKDGFKKSLISNNFCDDSKIRVLPMHTRWLFLNLILTCGDVNRDSVELASNTIRNMLECNRNIDGALDSLQQLQLLTFEKHSLIEENRIEKKVKESKRIPGQSKNEKKKPDSELNSKIWEAYRDAYFIRYKVDPPRNASVNSKISQIAKRLGLDAVYVVRFYLKHNDGFYLKTLHAIGPFLTNAESLHTQWKRNQPITSSDVRNLEKKIATFEVKKAIQEGENF